MDKLLLNPTELAWAAGFWDGEGCFSLAEGDNRNPNYKAIRCSITQVDPRPLQRFFRAVGGLGRIDGPRQPKNPRARPAFCWVSHRHEHTQAVAALLWKFLSEPKREQILRCFSVYRARKVRRQSGWFKGQVPRREGHPYTKAVS